MKYLAFVILCILCLNATARSIDTLYVESTRDVRYQRYLDSLEAYKIAYSVAKNVADSVKKIVGDNSYDHYFLSRFSADTGDFSGGYFFYFNQEDTVTIGHVNDSYHGMKNDARFPWKYLETEYKRLDSITVQPCGIMQGGELPNVYIYAKPKLVVIYHKVRRFTVLDTTIRFFQKSDGATKTSYITKLYYINDGVHQSIDSIEKLDPITHEHIDF